jgi:hypothetical protein
MSRGIMARVIEEIGAVEAEAQAERDAMVNVRPGEKVSAMLDLLAALSGRSASSLISQVLSLRLAQYATSSPENATPIALAAETSLKEDGWLQPGCALEMLKAGGIVETENPLGRQIRKDLF